MAEQLEPELTDFAPTVSTSDLSAFAADAEMVAEFVTEAREHLVAVEERLLLVENNASDLESINAVFRAIHTIKGLAGFLEFNAIQDIAHEVETLLDHARAGRLVITPTMVDVLFEGIDSIRTQVDGIQLQLAGGPPPPAAANGALMVHIREVASSAVSASGTVEPGRKAIELQVPEVAKSSLIEMPVTSTAEATEIRADGFPASGEVVPSSERNRNSMAAPAPAALPTAVPADDLSVRIDTSKLDQLMDMVGELVIANTVVSHNPLITVIQDSRLIANLALVSRITVEVQRITTSMRMVPIGIQFQKTARLIRDLSRQLGKQILFKTSGDDTEVDKTIAEAIADPLMHMVRNSIDHGIESTADRILSGKDPVATIRLAAYHHSAQIVIEISDDGRGLDRDRILRKATERGLIGPDAQLSDADIFRLIFEAGFSTAEKVTGISGRGVGMDVVREHVQKMRGRVDIESVPGIGTTFLLRLPLTLIIIEGLVIAVGDDRYILPIYSVTEIFCPDESQLTEDSAGGERVTVREIEMPVVRLHKRFDINPRFKSLTDGLLIATQAGGRPFCLFADEILGKQELVVKSLGDTFRNTTGLMGCAILSDGVVGLILDVEGIMP